MLSDTWTSEALSKALLSQDDWHPFPTSSEPDQWKAIPEPIRQAYTDRAAAALNHDWPTLPATLFLEFARNGNRRNYERVSFGRRTTLGDLIIAECIENEGRYLDDIVNGIWAICEESFWGIPACMNMQEHGPGLPDVEDPVVPLFVAETVLLLSWTVYLLKPQLDAVSPLVVDRIKFETDRRVLRPLRDREDFWWMGLGETTHPITGKKRRVNNWNPWIISNWLTTALILETDADARIEHVASVFERVDPDDPVGSAERRAEPPDVGRQ